MLLFPLQEWLEWCGLLWCFYQLFGLSFWRHPFTAEDTLISKWLQCKVLQIFSDEETNSSTSWMTWGWVHFQQMLFFCVNYSFNNHCVSKIWARFVIWCFCFSSPFVVILCLYCSRLACFRVVTVWLLWAVMCMWCIKYYCELKHSEIYSSNIKNISMLKLIYIRVHTFIQGPKWM